LPVVPSTEVCLVPVPVRARLHHHAFSLCRWLAASFRSALMLLRHFPQTVPARQIFPTCSVVRAPAAMTPLIVELFTASQRHTHIAPSPRSGGWGSHHGQGSRHHARAASGPLSVPCRNASARLASRGSSICVDTPRPRPTRMPQETGFDVTSDPPITLPRAQDVHRASWGLLKAGRPTRLLVVCHSADRVAYSDFRTRRKSLPVSLCGSSARK
jgi:hypothetical protein